MLLLVGARELGEKQRRAWPSPEVRDSTVTMVILLVQDGVPTCLPACGFACYGPPSVTMLARVGGERASVSAKPLMAWSLLSEESGCAPLLCV